MPASPLNRFAPALALAFVLAAGAPSAAAAAPGLPSSNVAWIPAAADADIDRAFSQGKARGRPVLLYWGASWCPPCNQLKATLFNRQDFAAQSRSFVAVHVDGDRPGAQKLGARFKVSGYPTLILFTPEGAEITRLPGEADAAQVMSLLQAGLAGGRPISDVLAEARTGKSLSPNEWRMLSFHSWDSDDRGVVSETERAAVLAELAAAHTALGAAVDAETTTRLWLKALAASDGGKGVKPDAALMQRVQRVLADPAQSRVHMDVLVNGAAEMVAVLADEDSGERPALLAQFDAALSRLQGDATLSRGDRVSALTARVQLARLGQGKETMQPTIAAALQRDVREMALRMDREVSDRYERQAVIPSAAYMLGQAGLWSESDALLRGNLARSPSPYYLMSGLASNARKQGHKDEALGWYRKAFDQSEGPATRLQWGASYLSALVDLAPQDRPRIEATAAQLLREAGRNPAAFYERSARSLQRIGKKLGAWNADGKNAAAMRRLRAQLAGVCARVDAADGRRAACEGLLAARSGDS